MASKSEWIAWAAGLFEGEGCATLAKKPGDAYDYAQLNLHTTDEDVIRRFHRVVGCGAVYGPYERKNAKPDFTWRCWKIEDVKRVYVMFKPYLHSRRRVRFAEVLSQDGRLVGKRRTYRKRAA